MNGTLEGSVGTALDTTEASGLITLMGDGSGWPDAGSTMYGWATYPSGARRGGRRSPVRPLGSHESTTTTLTYVRGVEFVFTTGSNVPCVGSRVIIRKSDGTQLDDTVLLNANKDATDGSCYYLTDDNGFVSVDLNSTDTIDAVLKAGTGDPLQPHGGHPWASRRRLVAALDVRHDTYTHKKHAPFYAPVPIYESRRSSQPRSSHQQPHQHQIYGAVAHRSHDRRAPRRPPTVGTTLFVSAHARAWPAARRGGRPVHCTTTCWQRRVGSSCAPARL